MKETRCYGQVSVEVAFGNAQGGFASHLCAAEHLDENRSFLLVAKVV